MTNKIKITLSSFFVLLAVASVSITKSPYAAFVLPAIVFCWLGDAALMQIGWFKDRFKEPLKAGMASFAAAHIVYAINFGYKAHDLGASSYSFAIVFVVYSTIAAATIFFRRIDVVLYGLMLSSVGAASFVLGFVAGGFWLLVPIGVAFFIASDAAIAVKEFKGRNIPHHDVVVWALYSAAQALIVGTPIVVHLAA